MKIIEEINQDVLARTIERCRERKIIIPTFGEQLDPGTIPPKISQKLADVGLWDVDPLNLFRITWKNDPETGLFNSGNWIEFPPELTGVDARIVGLVGKYFPTGAHKVGAGFGCLVPRLVSGNFDPTSHKAVWPSTGNYCRGGAFDCALLACGAVAILPEGMSRERFEWLREIGAEVIATPGCESNVKEIYDACWDIRRTRPDCVIFNQFEEFGNSIWHYHLTGNIIWEIYEQIARPEDRLAAYISATGSAGTIAAGDFLRKKAPLFKLVATEALQCPTLLSCGFGEHRIEGIGDKHVPWVHNIRNTDVVCAIDDEQTISLLRLFNEEQGVKFLEEQGVSSKLVEQLPLLGISSICNLVTAIKTARYYEMGSKDIIFTSLTDSTELYQSRLEDLRKDRGDYQRENAIRDKALYLEGIGIDHMHELNYYDRKRLHNFKYFTWVEQQGRTVEELRALWSDSFWEEIWEQKDEWDELIRQFNEQTGLLAAL